ncbi:MAG: hypothetical protein Q9M94_07695 [Candidatus Gracilibacteria bacterium]|nr:hypothetical protein [Candidatus Gracilibacteria bacterium]
MIKNIAKSLIIILIFLFVSINTSFAETEVISEDNILIKAFNERKDKLFEIINGGELNSEINNLKIEINKINSSSDLDSEVKIKLLEEIKTLEEKIERN